MKNYKYKYWYVFIICLSILASLGSAGAAFYLSEIINNPNMNDFVRMSIFSAISFGVEPVISILIAFLVTQNRYDHKEGLLNACIKKRMLFVESEEYNNKVNFLKSNNQEREVLSFMIMVSQAAVSMIALMFLLYCHLRWYWVIFDALLFVIVPLFSIRSNVKLSKLMSDFWVKYIQNTRYYNYISDVLSKKDFVEEKKVYGFFDFFVHIFDCEFEKAAAINKELGIKRIRLEEKNNIIHSLFIFGEIMFLAIACMKGFLPIGFFIAIFPFAVSTYSKVCLTVNGMNSLVQADRFFREEKNFLESENKPLQLNADAWANAEAEWAIKLEEVSFRYPDNDKIILDNISFAFMKGKRYAIVGVNGSGKTTLAKIISGLYEPQNGIVRTTGEVSVLFQDFVKYPFTIGENVALEHEYNVEKINGILDVLGMNAMVEGLEKGLESDLTNIKKDGVNLSGGQWQRIALARILYLSNDIVILDEPTASLDPKIEIEIYRDYMRAFEEKTVLFITHRLGYIKDVDEVLVLNEGKIVEHGVPGDLLGDNSTFFYQLFEEQRSLYES